VGSTQITDEEFEKFQADARLLYKRFTYRKMADLLKVETGNLSSYCNDKKRPGKRFFFKFYELFEKDLAELEGKDPHLSKTEEFQQPYGITRSKSLSHSEIKELITKLDKMSSAIESLQKDVTLLLKISKDVKTTEKKKPRGKTGH
jgi:transcriptional regulator with XRE-family HTH domain